LIQWVFAMKKIGCVNSQDAHVTRHPCNEFPAKMPENPWFLTHNICIHSRNNKDLRNVCNVHPMVNSISMGRGANGQHGGPTSTMVLWVGCET
jgi:hypothetical protein